MLDGHINANMVDYIDSRKSTKSDQHSLIIDLGNGVSDDLVGGGSYKNAPFVKRECTYIIYGVFIFAFPY